MIAPVSRGDDRREVDPASQALDRLEIAGLELWPPLKREWAATIATVRQRLADQDTEIQRLREERDAARKQSREASEMYVQANEQITELLQQESFMERKLAAQREDIERLATRVEAAGAENRRLTEGLRDLESAVRVLDVMLREPAAEGLMSAEDYRTYLQGAWLGVDEAAEKARALLSANPPQGDAAAGSSPTDGGGA